MSGRTVVVVSDTHLKDSGPPGRPPRWLPVELADRLSRADAILHAGDVVEPGVLERLSELAPVHAVLGNNDRSLVGLLPDSQVIEIADVRIGMVHDSGPARHRPARLARMFPDCRVVVFGHSHIPLDVTGEGGQLLFNPGSPTQRRRQPFPTYGLLRLAEGEVVEHRIVPLPV